jgi:3-oxoadipate CoA-transferase, beta subunit
MGNKKGLDLQGWSRDEMASRVADDIPEGWYVNLGIGLPTVIADHIPVNRDVIIHSENGILGVGPRPPPAVADPWLINAGKQHVTLRRGGSFFNQAESFGMIRGGHLDLCVLGGYQVAQNGDLANWSLNSDAAPAVGGAMDLAVGAKRVWVIMDHLAKDGAARLVERCSYPITAPRSVGRVYTNFAVFDVGPQGFSVQRITPGLTLGELQEVTGATFNIH